MIKMILFSLFSLISLNLFSQGFNLRFNEKQLNFILVDNSGNRIKCEHQLLKHVPWWEVKCLEREFTVDTWVQIFKSIKENKAKLTLMYHISEGVRSSGEPLVQFRTHFTTFIVSGLTNLSQIESFQDVGNGLSSLILTVNLK